MKKRQLSQKKISSIDNINRSQTKISSFFKKIPKNDHKDKVLSTPDINSLFQASGEKKRKQKDDPFEKESHRSIKRKRSETDTLEEYNVTRNIKSRKDSVLLSITNDLEETCNNFKENKMTHTEALPPKMNKEEINATRVKTDQNTTVLSNSASTGNTQVSDIANSDHVFKESQDLNTVALKSTSSELCSPKKIKLLDAEKESLEDPVTVDGNDFGDDFFNEEWHVPIDFTKLQRCKVINVKHEPNVTILTVQHVESESIDTVTCLEFWRHMHVKLDDIVMIQAKKDSQQWFIDNNNGYLVTQPDVLVSITTIASSIFCNRQAVLSEKFRKIESLPNLNGDFSTMTVGSLVHQWLQKALGENAYTFSDVIKLLDDILQSKDTIDYLYASEMSLTDCRERMTEYAQRIVEFIQHYIKGEKQKRISNLRDNFQGDICKIQDIEENVFVPEFGIKGRIDVTAEVKIHSRRKIMPLEVKTGRASYSLQHRGQVILYLMMMGFRDQDIDTGLLLYLKENSMQEIRSSHHEKRDLMLLRNTLAHYMTQKLEDQNVDSPSDLKMMELPEPIYHHSACAKCSYQNICCAYLTRDPNANLLPTHPLTVPIKELLDNFESSHLDYILTWIALLQLEESYENSNNSLSSIWTTCPEKREAKGTCICNLKVVGQVVKQDDRYLHAFARVDIKGEAVEKGLASGNTFSEDDFIMVSTDARINIANGSIVCISHDVLTVLLAKDITQQDANSTFHIDKYSFGSLSTYNYANVAGLLSNDEAVVKLRRIVIDKRPATFVEKLPRSVVSASAEIIRDLNENQQRAVLKAVAAKEYVLIKGMPGTGKTRTLVTLIELLLELGSSILITAHTNSAVDNVLLKLLERNIDFLRLGSKKQIHPLLTCKSEAYAIASCDSPESLEALYNSKRVVGVTCYGAYHALIRRRSFDVCVVDESAQIMQPTVLRPLYSARKFVLVGDPDQLPPVVRNKTAVKLGADKSLFVRLDSDNNTINLSEQYRMNGRIMRLANDVTYHGKLISGNKKVENAMLTGSNMEQVLSSCERWIARVFSRNLEDSVILLNTGKTCNLSVESPNENVTSDQVYSNVWEAAVIFRLVQVLIEAGVYARNIGIIAPYNAHINLLKKIINKEVEVNTVDQYQGRDKDIILYSCVKSVESNAKKEFEILVDLRRLTVAITRARHKLIVIADKVTLTGYKPFKRLFDVIDEKNVINLHDGEEDFSWKNLVCKINSINSDK